MKTRRICIILPEGLPVPAIKGGAIETLISNLITQNEARHELELLVFSSYDSQASEQAKQYNYSNIKFIKKDALYWLVKVWFKLVRIFVKKFDKIVYNELVLRQIKNEPIDYVIVEQGNTSAFGSYLRYFKKEQMVFHSHSDEASTASIDRTFGHYICVSEFVKNIFKESSTIKDCAVLKNGINIEPFTMKDSIKISSAKAKYHIKDNDIVLLFCGRIVPKKGILELIKAVKEIDDKHLKLIIVGSVNFGDNQKSTFLNNIMQLVKELGNQIIMTGYIHNSKIPIFHHISDIFIFPSICEESAGLTAIEAMAAGLPIITTKFGGIPEYVHPDNIFIDRCYGDEFVQKLKKEILRLVDDQRLRQELSVTNQLHANKYSDRQYYSDFVEIIRSYDERI